MAGYKVKTNSGAAKRFKINSKGRIKRKKAYLRHGMSKRSQDCKRVLRKKGCVSKADEGSIRCLLPNG
ncbi:50S ribosomal protein L35 [Deltaproteobacteria bacterium TL4]